MIKIRRALLSVSDKTGLIPFAKGLAEHGVALLSTGGTAKAIRRNQPAQQLPIAEELLLSDELFEVSRTHPRGQRSGSIQICFFLRFKQRHGLPLRVSLIGICLVDQMYQIEFNFSCVTGL